MENIVTYYYQLSSSYPLIPMVIGVTSVIFFIFAIVLFYRYHLKKKLPSTQQKKYTKHLSVANPWEQGLAKTRTFLHTRLKSIFHGHNSALQQDITQALHEALFKADISINIVDKILKDISSELQHTKDITFDVACNATKKSLKNLIAATSITTDDQSNNTAINNQPKIILVTGVNGAGKTTTIAKLANRYQKQGQKVALCAADTFRAAAIEQLQTWGQRLNIKVFASQQGKDPGAIVYEAIEQAQKQQLDTLIIDTAGRLQNHQPLMDELRKITRVIQKVTTKDADQTLLVIDATTGQNAYTQIAGFNKVTPLSGLIVTKLDGTAKGGIIIGAIEHFKIPVCYLGIGEKIDDLVAFDSDKFVDSII